MILMKCYEEGECFGKWSKRTGKMTDLCHILVETYPEDVACPFKKEKREWTNGVHYMHKYDD